MRLLSKRFISYWSWLSVIDDERVDLKRLNKFFAESETDFNWGTKKTR
jgi:hypothetical protein